MYAINEKIKAVELLIQYDMHYSAVIRELGYPDPHSLRHWYNEYKTNGCLHDGYSSEATYTEKQKEDAIKYYIEHGRCLSTACRKLG